MESQQRRQLTKLAKVMIFSGVILGCLTSSIIASGADNQTRKGTVIKTQIQTSTEDNNQQTDVASSSSVTDTSLSQVESTPAIVTQVTSSVVVETSSSKFETETKVKEENEEEVETLIEEEEETVDTDEETFIPENTWEGEVLDPYKGMVQGPSGTEVYYNLDMGVCVQNLQNLGFEGSQWVRDEDGVQMFGQYVMVAANLDYRPKGTILLTSLGWAIVADECEAAYWGDPYLIDISVTW